MAFEAFEVEAFDEVEALEVEALEVLPFVLLWVLEVFAREDPLAGDDKAFPCGGIGHGFKAARAPSIRALLGGRGGGGSGGGAGGGSDHVTPIDIDEGGIGGARPSKCCCADARSANTGTGAGARA